MPGLFYRKRRGVAEDVAVFGKLLLLDAGEHFFDHEFQVAIAITLVLFGYGVGALECADVARTAVFIELLNDSENFHLRREGQAVSRFCFDGCSATAPEPLAIAPRSIEQCALTHLSRL